MRRHFYLVVDSPKEDFVGGVDIHDMRYEAAKKNEQRTIRKHNVRTDERFTEEVVSLGYHDFEDEADYDDRVNDVVLEKLQEIDDRHLEAAGVENDDLYTEEIEVLEYYCSHCGWTEPVFQRGDPALCSGCSVAYEPASVFDEDGDEYAPKSRTRTWPRCSGYNEDRSRCENRASDEYCHHHKDVATDGGVRAVDEEQLAEFGDRLAGAATTMSGEADELAARRPHLDGHLYDVEEVLRLRASDFDDWPQEAYLDTESAEELKRRELAGYDLQRVIEQRMDYIIQSFSNIHAKWGRTRRCDEPELESMKDDVEFIEEVAWELQIAIDLYRAEVGGWRTDTAEGGDTDE